MKITKEDILKYGTKDEVEFLMEKSIGTPRPKSEKKLCAKCGKKLKHGHAKGGICDTCASNEHLDKESVQKSGEILKETGEMGRYDIEKDGEFYEAAQTLKKAAQHIQKLTDGMLKFKTVRPFDVYQGPYAQCEVLGHWGRLWFGGNDDDIDPEYFLETSERSSNPDDDIAGDVYKIAHLIRKMAKEKYGMK